MKPTRTDIKRALENAWSIRSSSKWTEQIPEAGQCGVTALLVHELLGGDILKTELPEGWHFYNRVDGKRCDFTESQFATPIVYQDLVSDRAEAFADTNEQQYAYLIEAVRSQLLS